MKKLISFLLLIFGFVSFVISKPIDETRAKIVGQNFISNKANITNLTLSLVYTSASKASMITQNTLPTNYFYVFNINQDKGFVIVAADDVVLPVLGYSLEKGFEPKNIPAHISEWLDGYSKQISFSIDNKLAATPEIIKQWTDLANGNIPDKKLNKKGAVNPLIITRWNQTPYYNELCPFDIPQGSLTLTGCVATTMAQIMKYWNYPTKGQGLYSYTIFQYGSLKANFGATTYNWAAMPNDLKDTNTSLATLMYHCGISVGMNYGISGSSAYTADIPNALKTYFGYLYSIQHVQRKSYTEAQWIALLKQELDAKRPVIYAGYPSSGSGHCFINDGYDATDYFHFNWGWGGYYDGYFSVNALNPGSNYFNKDQHAVIGIEPSRHIEMNSEISTNRPYFVKGSNALVSLNLINKKDTTFYGKYRVCLFNQDKKTVLEIIDSISETNGLAFNGSKNITFTNAQIKSNAGSYLLGVQFKRDNSTLWDLPQAKTFKNFINFTIKDSVYVYPKDIYEVNDEYGNSFSLPINYTDNKADVNTIGSNCHTADDIDYYKLVLPKGYNYTIDARLQDSKSNNNGESYTLDVLFSYSTGGSSWSDSYEDVLPNSIKINGGGTVYFVVTSGLNGGNGTYLLDMKISRVSIWSSSKNISGFTIGGIVGKADIDTIAATVKVLVNATTNITSVSPVITISSFASINPASGVKKDFTAPVNYTVKAQDSSAKVWTVTITKQSNSMIDKLAVSNLISIYPNPADGFIDINLSDIQLRSDEVTITDIQGKVIHKSRVKLANNTFHLDIEELKNEIYFLQLDTEKGVITKKLAIVKL